MSVSDKPGSGCVCLPLTVTHRAADEEMNSKLIAPNAMNHRRRHESEDDDGQRDTLGNAGNSARMMITGGMCGRSGAEAVYAGCWAMIRWDRLLMANGRF